MIRADVKIIKADLQQHEFIYLVPLSDFHWDEPQSDHEAIQGYVDWIAAHENAYTLLNGDLWTIATKQSAASVFETAEPGERSYKLIPLDTAFDEVEALLKPIADRILCADSGGHELKHMFREVGSDYTYRLMKNLKREKVYARDGGVLLLKTAPATPEDASFFVSIFTHGWGSARTRGAKIRKLEYLAQGFECDIVILSHDHTQNLTRDNRLIFPDWEMEYPVVHRVMLVATGAFRGYAGYPFRSGYQPADLGTPRIRIGKRISPEGVVRKDIHASI